MQKYSIFMLLGALSMGAAAQSPADSSKVTRLPEVEVVGTKVLGKTPMSYSKISKEEIRKDKLVEDVPYLLTLTPGLVATSDAGSGVGYTSLRIRGVDATRINVMMGGVPINDSESQGVFWVNMPDLSSSLGEIQVQRGVGTSSNGAAAFGASVNMQSEHLSLSPYLRTSLSGGSFGTFKRTLQLGSGRFAGRWAAEARLSWLNSNGYIDRATSDLSSYFFQGGYFGDRTTLKFISFGGKERTGIAWNGLKFYNGKSEDLQKWGRTYNSAGFMYLESDGKPHYYQNTDNYQQYHHHLVFRHQLSDSWKLGVTAHYTRGYGYTDEFRTGRKLKEYGLQKYKIMTANGEKEIKKVSLIRQKHLDNHFGGYIASLDYTTGNLSISFGQASNYYQGDHYGIIRWIERYKEVVQPDFRYYQNEGKKLDVSGFAKVYWTPLESLDLFADLQYRFIRYQIDGVIDNYDDTTGRMQELKGFDKKFNFFNPKVGALYHFNENNFVFASLAVGHREPDRHSYTDVLPKNYPTSENLVDYELGYNYNSEALSLGVNLYYMDYINQLVATGEFSDVGQAIMTNVKDSYRMGLEFSLGWKPLSWLRWDLVGGLSKNKIKRYTYNFSVYDDAWDWSNYQPIEFKDTDIAMSPALTLGNRIGFHFGGLDLAFSTHYVGKQYLDNTSSKDRMLKAYSYTNLYLGYGFKLFGLKECRLSLTVNNLFDQKYYGNGYVYDMGIDHTGKTYNDLRYYPQAGINALAGISIDF